MLLIWFKMYGMKKQQTFTAREFAAAMDVTYTTVLTWLADGRVPGAAKRQSPIGEWWEIPAKALAMEKPKPGPKPPEAEVKSHRKKQ
jgi:hypothetical protein